MLRKTLLTLSVGAVLGAAAIAPCGVLHDAVAAYGGGGSDAEDGCYSSDTYNHRRVVVCDE